MSEFHGWCSRYETWRLETKDLVTHGVWALGIYTNSILCSSFVEGGVVGPDELKTVSFINEEKWGLESAILNQEYAVLPLSELCRGRYQS